MAAAYTFSSPDAKKSGGGEGESSSNIFKPQLKKLPLGGLGGAGQEPPLFSMHHRRPDPAPRGAGDASPELARRRVAEIRRLQDAHDREEELGLGPGAAGAGAVMVGGKMVMPDDMVGDTVLDYDLLDDMIGNVDGNGDGNGEQGGRRYREPSVSEREEAAELAMDELLEDLTDYDVKEGDETLERSGDEEAAALRAEVERQFEAERASIDAATAAARGTLGARPLSNGPGGSGGFGAPPRSSNRYEKPRMMGRLNSPRGGDRSAELGGGPLVSPRGRRPAAAAAAAAAAGPALFKCEVCGRAFKKATHLRVHSNVHVREQAQPKDDGGGSSTNGADGAGSKDRDGGGARAMGEAKGGGALDGSKEAGGSGGRIASYIHDGTRGVEAVRVVREHSDAEGGGVTIVIPSLGRERQTVRSRLLDDGGAEARAANEISGGGYGGGGYGDATAQAKDGSEGAHSPIRSSSSALDDDALFSIGRPGGRQRRISPDAKASAKDNAGDGSPGGAAVPLQLQYHEQQQQQQQQLREQQAAGDDSGDGAGIVLEMSRGADEAEELDDEEDEVDATGHKAHIALADQINADAKQNGPDMDAMHRLWDMMQGGIVNAEAERAAMVSKLEKGGDSALAVVQPGGGGSGGGSGKSAVNQAEEGIVGEVMGALGGGEMMPGGMMPGGMVPGGMMPGGMVPGGMMPGGMMPGGMMPGGMMPGGMMPGMGAAMPANANGGGGGGDAAAQQRMVAAVAQRERAEAEARAAEAAARQAAAERAELEEQSAKMQAMMEAMGAAGARDLGTLSAHAMPHEKHGALKPLGNNKGGGKGGKGGPTPGAVNGLLKDVALSKLDDGNLTMAEAGAALSAVMAQGGMGGIGLPGNFANGSNRNNSNNASMTGGVSANAAADAEMLRHGATLAAGKRPPQQQQQPPPPHQRQRQHQLQHQHQHQHQHQPQSDRAAVLAARVQQRRTAAAGGGGGGGGDGSSRGGGGRVASFGGSLGEAQSRFPELWGKWLQKLDSKGYLDGMAAGSAEHELHLERAAAKFLQSKAIVKLKDQQNAAAAAAAGRTL